MSEQPNVARSLLHIHHIITRGLDVSIAKSREFAETGFPNPSMKDGFVKYVGAFVTVLDAHHKTEDEMAFPYLRTIVETAPFKELEEEHKIIEEILPQIRTALQKIASGAEEKKALASLQPLLASLKQAWHPHIEKEEKNFPVDLLGNKLAPEEHVRLIQELSAHTRKIAKPDEVIVPFLLYNLEENERAAFSKALPSVVTEQLIPVVWKEKWQPMLPFFLK
jgi:hemerythrin-like domain-containing protein